MGRMLNPNDPALENLRGHQSAKCVADRALVKAIFGSESAQAHWNPAFGVTVMCIDDAAQQASLECVQLQAVVRMSQRRRPCRGCGHGRSSLSAMPLSKHALSLGSSTATGIYSGPHLKNLPLILRRPAGTKQDPLCTFFENGLGVSCRWACEFPNSTEVPTHLQNLIRQSLFSERQ